MAPIAELAARLYKLDDELAQARELVSIDDPEMAAEARAEVELVAALAPSGTADALVLRARRERATARLAESVAALESIRLDLLRLHANANDLAPLTTLIDAARLLGEDLSRLAEAQREVEDAAPSGSVEAIHPPGSNR